MAYLFLVRRMRIAFMTGLAVLLGVASSVHARPLEPPSAAQLREWASPDCINAGKYAGFDYARALERAIRKEPFGLAQLFRATYTVGFDGGAGETHSAILFGLLQRWGDRRFAHVLRAQKLRIRKAVIDTIPIPPGSRLKFPLTYASAPH